MRSTTTARHATIVFVLCLTIAACGQQAGPAATEPAPTADDAATPEPDAEFEPDAELTTLTIGTIPIANIATVYAAEQLGFFADEGLNIETASAEQGAALVAAVQGGSLDFVYSNYVSVILANSEGFDLSIFGNLNSARTELPDSAGVLVRADSDIESAQDLVGKRIGLGSLNSLAWLYFREWIRQEGLDPDQDVQYFEVPFSSMGDALANDQVDAAFGVEPYNTILESEGAVRMLAHPYVEVQPGVQIAGWLSTTEWIEENSEVAAAFMRAIDRSVQHLNANPDEKVQMIAEFTDSDPGLVEQLVLDDWRTAFDVEDLQAIADLIVKEGMVEGPIDASDYYIDVTNE